MVCVYMVYVYMLLIRQLTWEVIAWLRSVTKLKLVIKGVMTPEDAATAAWKHGVAGIWVSNHGARQVDTAPATIEVRSLARVWGAHSQLACWCVLSGRHRHMDIHGHTTI